MPTIADGTSRVTTFELFFDLVYVFAFTQVSRLMAETHSAVGVAQALIVLSLMWWTWVGFSWISNSASADQPFLRTVMSAAMIAVFVAALTIPEAYEDLAGGWSGPLVFACAYAAVRIIHVGLYAVVGWRSPALLRQLGIFMVAMIPAVALVVTGALVGGVMQVWLWLIAIVYDVAATRVGSALGQGWRLPSAEHWAERHGLVVILALGESIVAIGVGVAQEPIDLPIVVGSALSVVVSVLLWWSYFARLAVAGEEALLARDEKKRALLGSDAYSYAHFVIIAGIIVTALGIEDAMKHIADAEPFGWFGAAALGGGIATFALGTIVFAVLIGQRRFVMRAVEAGVVLLSIPLLAAVPPLAALAIAVTLMAVVALVETRLHRGGAHRA
ncbi:hypothetical protein GCM10027024_20010 [Microbacterium insulae]